MVCRWFTKSASCGVAVLPPEGETAAGKSSCKAAGRPWRADTRPAVPARPRPVSRSGAGGVDQDLNWAAPGLPPNQDGKGAGPATTAAEAAEAGRFARQQVPPQSSQPPASAEMRPVCRLAGRGARRQQVRCRPDSARPN